MQFIQKKKEEISQQYLDKYREKFINPLVAEIMAARDISPEEALSFLNPDIEELHDPFLFKNMRKTVDRILLAKEREEYVAVYGDYDCDGICSCAILKKTFDELGIKSRYYIPDRFSEGYGTNSQAIESLIDEGVTLIITVDCGIRSTDDVKEAAEKNVDMIITDHHEPDELPDTPYILNPKVSGETYPFNDLAGAGIAFKLSQALLGEKALEYIDLAAIATIADMVKLRGENRIISYFGLKRINERPSPGISAIINSAGIKRRPINSYNIGFNVAPRINAAGRMEHAYVALETLLEEEYEKAYMKALEIDTANARRQAIQENIISEANRYIEENINVSEKRVILVKNEKWHKGILGLAAAHLSRRYNRPVIVFNETDDMLTGSARSIDDINIYDAIYEAREFLTRFGGHSKAAGLSLHSVDFGILDEKLNSYFLENVRDELFVSKVRYDFPLKVEEISTALIEQLEMLEPFGEGNPEPVFLIQGYVPGNVISFGEGKKYRKAIENNAEIIYFSHEKDFSAGNRYILTGVLSKNVFRDQVTNTFTVRDINLDSEKLEDVLRYKNSGFVQDFFAIARDFSKPLDESVTRIDTPEELKEYLEADISSSPFGTAVFVDSVPGLKIAFEGIKDLKLDREVLFYSNFSNNMICFSKPTEEPINYHSIYVIGGFEPPMENFDEYRVYIYRGDDLRDLLKEEYQEYYLSPEELEIYREKICQVGKTGFENMRELMRLLSAHIKDITMKKLFFAMRALQSQNLIRVVNNGRIFAWDNQEKSLDIGENPLYNLF